MAEAAVTHADATPTVAGAGVSSTTYKISAEISGTKVRIYIRGHNGSSPAFLIPVLSDLFKETPSCHIPSDIKRYSAIGFSRCFQVLESSARLEFWFPSTARLGNDEASRLIDILLKALDLPEGELPAGATYSSISTLGDREYKDIIPETIVYKEKIIPLCTAFKAATEAFKRKRGCEFHDKIEV